MTSLSGGLIPVKGSRSPTSTLDAMDPLEPLSTKSATTNPSDGFDDDMFDDLLDAPTKPKKKSKSKGGKKASKSSSKKSRNKGQNFDDPPLSPDMGNSFDDLVPVTNKFNTPAGVNEGDLDDSILGGLLGGGKSRRSSQKKTDPIDIRPKSTSHASDGKDANSGFRDGNELAKDSSRPQTTGSRRPRNNFKDGGENDSLDHMPSFPNSRRSNKYEDDFDDSIDVIDRDPRTTPVEFNSENSRPSSSVAKEENALWGENEGASSLKGEHASSQKEASGATKFNLNEKKHTMHDNSNQDESLDFDFDVDNLLPDNNSELKTSATVNQIGSTSNSRTLTTSSTAATITPHLPSGPLSSKGRSPSPSKGHSTVSDSGQIHSPSQLASKSPSSSPQLSNSNKKSPDEDDVDLGFMPSFLESGREPRSRRQLGVNRSKSSRGRAKSRLIDDDVKDDSLDALDAALGISSSSSARNSGRVQDPFGATDTKLSQSSASSKRQEGTASPNKETAKSPSFNTLPSLSRKTNSNTISTKETEENPELPESTRDDKTRDVEKRGDKRAQKAHRSSELTVTVDVPSDKPMSNPPTVTVVDSENYNLTDEKELKQSASVKKTGEFSPDVVNPQDTQGESLGSSMPSKPAIASTTSQHSVTFNTRTDSPHIVHSPKGGDSARKILKKTSAHAPDLESSSGSVGKLEDHESMAMGTTTRVSNRRHSHEGLVSRGADQGATVFSNSAGSPSHSVRKPTWLSPTSAALSQSLDLSSDNIMSTDATVRSLRQKIEEISIQKETVEKYLRAEIEALKSKSSGSTPRKDPSTRSDAVDQSVEVQNLKLKLVTLTQENARLKEENVVEKAQHQKEIIQLREKHAMDMDAGNARRAEEIEMMERRHKETITSLKKIHMDELAAVKQRSKDGAALEQLASQITNTSGALKMIEEQLSLQYRGVDAVREGQFEARERLLQEMEAQAREKVEGAEVESFKVKGLLSHMEQVISSLRSQGGEERERLRQEHRRLEAMQSSLDAERSAMQERFSTEMEHLKRKIAAAEEAAQSDALSRSSQMAEVAETRRKLEAERKEFAAYVSTSVKAAEKSAQSLKEEESRLLALRTEVAQEQSKLDQQKYDAEEQLSQAASWRRHFQRERLEVQRERESLEELAREIQKMSDMLVEKDSSVSLREQELAAKEQELREERESLSADQEKLSAKERQLAQFNFHADQQRMAMKQLEDEMLERRTAVCARQREISKLQQQHASDRLALALTSVRQSDASQKGVNKENSQLQTRSSPNRKHQKTENQSHVPVQRKLGFDFDKEILSARETMQKARGGVAKVSSSNIKRKTFLQSENEFMSRLQSSYS